ncbi:MAG: hypothetical protein HFACDABA_01993 [Anaerolineales bacterium]|nr:hypothetical protein [Anaerolineales bacterium]
MINRAELIIQHFDYLTDKYGFRVERKEFYPDAMGNAVVIFKSPVIGIEVVIDRNQALIRIGDQSEELGKWFEFSNVLSYFAPSLEKAYVFTEKTENNTWDQVVETQLKRLAEILLDCCESLLRGDLSGKERIKKIEHNRKIQLIEELNDPSKRSN